MRRWERMRSGNKNRSANDRDWGAFQIGGKWAGCGKSAYRMSSRQSRRSANAPIADVCHVIGYRAAQWRLSKQHINVGRGTINATMNEIDIGLS